MAFDALRERLEAATAFAATEPNVPATWKQVERAATAVLLRERAAGAIRGFVVRCDAELNPPGSEGMVVEVVLEPPQPRVARVVVRVGIG